MANWAAILAAIAAAAAAASDADFPSSVLATFEGVVASAPGAGSSHFLFDGFGGSPEVEDIFVVVLEDQVADGVVCE